MQERRDVVAVRDRDCAGGEVSDMEWVDPIEDALREHSESFADGADIPEIARTIAEALDISDRRYAYLDGYEARAYAGGRWKVWFGDDLITTGRVRKQTLNEAMKRAEAVIRRHQEAEE